MSRLITLPAPRAALIPRAEPTAQFCADARHIISHPEEFAGRPLLRRLAWATLQADAQRRALASTETRQ